eukprot:scaffold1019_cov172-Amphora_coffeaeformis.AAC.5
MQHANHTCRLSSFVNRSPKAPSGGDGDDSLYQFGSVAWEPNRQTSSRLSELPSSPALGKKSVDDTTTSSTRSSSKSKGSYGKQHNNNPSMEDKKKLRGRPKPELTKEQKKIANEIRDFLHREKSQRSFSSMQFGGSGNSKCSNNSPRRRTTTLASALGNLPSTPKQRASPTRTKNVNRTMQMMPAPYTSPYSARSHRSVPMLPTQPLVSPYSVRSTRTVPSNANALFAKNKLLSVPPAPVVVGRGGGGYESSSSDRVPRKSNKSKYKDNTLQDEDAPCEKNYYSDASSASEDSSCLFSDYFSENDGADGDHSSSSSSSSRKHRSSFSWSMLTKGRAARRHHRLRASSPPPNDITEGDVTDLLGGSILQKHGA